MATLIYIFMIIISILVHDSFQQNTTIPAIGTDCKGNDFLCMDQIQFLICVQSDDRFETADQNTQTCGPWSYCDNNLNYECASSVPVIVAPNLVNTTMPPQTTDGTTESTTALVNSTTTPPEASIYTTEEISTTVLESNTTRETTTVSFEGTPQFSTTAQSGVTDEILDSTTEGVGNTTESVPQYTRPSRTEAVTSDHVNDTTKYVESTTNVSAQSTTTINATTEDTSNVTTISSSTEGITTNHSTPTETVVPTESTTTITVQTSITVNSGSSDTTKDSSIKPSTWAFGTTTTPAPTTYAPRFVCPSTGFYPHLTDCRKFVLCLKFGRYYHSISIPCPFNWVFNQKANRCSSKKPKASVNTTIFRCFSEGYFNDPYSMVKYYICTSLGKGSFRQSEFKCPSHLVFSNYQKRCICIHGNSGEDGESRKKNFWDSSNSSESNSGESRSNESPS